MTQPLCVHLLPELFAPQQLAGGVAVIIDILRASSTMVTALCHGAAEVIPCLTIEDAWRCRSAGPSDSVLLGGERGGLRIEGFELSNSPADYGRQTVAMKTIAFTTTNGTRALLRSVEAAHVVVGCFLNLRCLAEWLRTQPLPIHLVCAGTDGQITGEDVLFAGAVVQALSLPATGTTESLAAQVDSAPQPCPGPRILNDAAQLARSYWIQTMGAECFTGLTAPHPPTENAIRAVEFAMRETQGGRNLRQLGYADDIRRCSQIDAAAVIPVYCRHRHNLTLPSPDRA
jgi:2-phosphosulfolactate phosphatase